MPEYLPQGKLACGSQAWVELDLIVDGLLYVCRAAGVAVVWRRTRMGQWVVLHLRVAGLEGVGYVTSNLRGVWVCVVLRALADVFRCDGCVAGVLVSRWICAGLRVPMCDHCGFASLGSCAWVGLQVPVCGRCGVVALGSCSIWMAVVLALLGALLRVILQVLMDELCGVVGVARVVVDPVVVVFAHTLRPLFVCVSGDLSGIQEWVVAPLSGRGWWCNIVWMCSTACLQGVCCLCRHVWPLGASGTAYPRRCAPPRWLVCRRSWLMARHAVG